MHMLHQQRRISDIGNKGTHKSSGWMTRKLTAFAGAIGPRAAATMVTVALESFMSKNGGRMGDRRGLMVLNCNAGCLLDVYFGLSGDEVEKL